MADLVDAPIERIELFEDRAAVTRRVRLPDGAGRRLVRIAGISPLVSERHLVWPGTTGLLVEEARIERWRTTRREADPEVAARLEARHRELEAEIGALEDAARRASERVTRAAATVQAALGWSPRLLASAEAPSVATALRELAEQRTRAHTAAVEAEEALGERRREHALVAASLQAARVGAPEWVCALLVQLRVEDPEPSLCLRYTIPCALWRPTHRATLRLPSPRLAWEVGAMVWNTTGEDWRGVTLVCSTARPGDHATPPVLGDDLLRSRRREQQIVVEAREEVVQVAREGEAQRTSEVPGVDDGGEPRTYTAPLPVDLPSDGRPVHVRLESWEAEASVTWLAHPERSPQVVLRSRQPNGASRPLLAGPVDLYTTSDAADARANAVGRGRIGFVPPGEPFALGWGSHDAVRVTRKSEAKVERARLTGRQTWRFSVIAKVANLGAEAVDVRVRERIPVSEIGEVTVQPPTATPPLDNGPDQDGLCTWRVALAPGEVRELNLAWTVEAPASVRLDGALG